MEKGTEKLKHKALKDIDRNKAEAEIESDVEMTNIVIPAKEKSNRQKVH